MRLQPISWPTPLDVFYTHMQNIATSDGVSALYAQLDHANQFMGLHGAPNVPKIMMGDLNIPAADYHHYEQLIIRLRGPRLLDGRRKLHCERGYVGDGQQLLRRRG